FSPHVHMYSHQLKLLHNLGQLRHPPIAEYPKDHLKSTAQFPNLQSLVDYPHHTPYFEPRLRQPFSFHNDFCIKITTAPNQFLEQEYPQSASAISIPAASSTTTLLKSQHLHRIDVHATHLQE